MPRPAETPLCRGADGKDASPLPLLGSLPACCSHGDMVRDRRWPARMVQLCPPLSVGSGAPLHSINGMGPAAPAKSLQQLHPSLMCEGLHPPQPLLARGLLWDGQEKAASSFPQNSRWQGWCHRDSERTSQQHEARGQCQPTAPALISFRSRGCSCRCLVCGLVPAYILSQGTGLAVFPA